jgi:hypothetical protein
VTRRSVWVIEGKWREGADRAWGPIFDRGPYPTRTEAAGNARQLGDRNPGCQYRAARYVGTERKR